MDRGALCSPKMFASESHGNSRKRQRIPGEGMIDLEDWSVDNSPINHTVKSEEKKGPASADLVKEFSSNLETCGQLLNKLSNDFRSIQAMVSPDVREVANGDGVPYISHLSSRGVRNRGGRPRGHSTLGNRGSR